MGRVVVISIDLPNLDSIPVMRGPQLPTSQVGMELRGKDVDTI